MLSVNVLWLIVFCFFFQVEEEVVAEEEVEEDMEMAPIIAMEVMVVSK